MLNSIFARKDISCTATTLIGKLNHLGKRPGREVTCACAEIKVPIFTDQNIVSGISHDTTTGPCLDTSTRTLLWTIENPQDLFFVSLDNPGGHHYHFQAGSFKPFRMTILVLTSTFTGLTTEVTVARSLVWTESTVTVAMLHCLVSAIVPGYSTRSTTRVIPL